MKVGLVSEPVWSPNNERQEKDAVSTPARGVEINYDPMEFRQIQGKELFLVHRISDRTIELLKPVRLH